MRIHSIHGCSCWRYLRSADKYEREEAREQIQETGHTEVCGKARRKPWLAKKDPRKVCCYRCSGQGRCFEWGNSEKMMSCLDCLGSGQVDAWRDLRARQAFAMRSFRHDNYARWRKRLLWRAYDDAKARLKEATKDATDDQIEELELSLKELMDHLRMQFSEMRVARWHRRGGRRDVAEDIEQRAGLR